MNNNDEEIEILRNTCSTLEAQVKLLVRTEIKLRRTQAELVQSKEIIEEYNKTLEQKVDERTRELNESYKFIESVISSMTDPFVVIDTAGKIIKANQAMIDLVTAKGKNEIGNEQILGRDIIEFLPVKGIFHEQYPGLFTMSEPTTNFEVNYKISKDKTLDLSLSAAPVFNMKNQIISTVIIIHNITKMKQIEKNLKYIATHDVLTNLPNRILLNDRVHHAIIQAHRNKRFVFLMLLDLDHFKEVNDTLGHDVGDLLLKEVSVKIQGCMREQDTLSRMGGDEFVIAAEDLHNDLEVAVIAERIIKTFESPIIIKNHVIQITTSIGISSYPTDGEDIESLLKYADLAMYSAKKLGGNTFCFFKSRMGKILEEKIIIRDELKKALERNEFVLHYQPLVDTKSGKIVSAEALIRWQHPKHGLVSPGNFIEIAEKTGLILPIGKQVLHAACTQGKMWIEKGYDALPLAVNFSTLQLYEDNMVNKVVKILDETGFPPENLIIEITESSAMHNIEISLKVIKELCNLGIKIYIDDFGSGYSSLNRLKMLPIHALKIDKFFVQNIVDDSFDAAIVMAVIIMAHSMNIKVIAEGVETREQLDFLRSIELKYEKKLICDLVQGFLFSKPVPSDEFLRFLSESPEDPAFAAPTTHYV